QGVEVGGAQNQNDVVLAGVHILLLHLGEQTGQGRVDRSGVRAVGRRDGLRGAALVARGAVRRRRQQGGLDGLDEERLVAELGDALALGQGQFLAGVEAGLEHVQQRQNVAGQDHRVDGHGRLREVGVLAVRRYAGLEDLQARVTNRVVGERGGALNRADVQPALQDRAAGQDLLDLASKFFNGEFENVASAAGQLVLLQRADYVKSVKRH